MRMGWEQSSTRVLACEVGRPVWRLVPRPVRDATRRRCGNDARDSRAPRLGRASTGVRVENGAARRPEARAGAVGGRHTRPAVQQRLEQSAGGGGSLRSLDFSRPQLNLGRWSVGATYRATATRDDHGAPQSE